MKRLRNTALMLILAAGSLALPAAAQQEVMPDIYDASARSSMPAKKAISKPSAVRTKNEMGKPAKHQAAHHPRHKSSNHVMLASAKTPKAATK